MRSSRAVEISTGLFVLLGFASLFFLVTQITNRELTVNGSGSYEVNARFENVGSLKPGAAVSMAGVTVGRVESIIFDQNIYKAVVTMRIASDYNRIPADSDAAIMTSGLLGGQYVGITAGGAEEYLKSGDRIELVQDALVLENLINQFAANFAKGGNDDRSTSGSQAEAGEAKSGTQSDQPKTEEAKP